MKKMNKQNCIQNIPYLDLGFEKCSFIQNDLLNIVIGIQDKKRKDKNKSKSGTHENSI